MLVVQLNRFAKLVQLIENDHGQLPRAHSCRRLVRGGAGEFRQTTLYTVERDSGEPAPVSKEVASGASDPMAISLEPFERQFLDFGEAVQTGRKPLCSGEEGYAALEIVDAVYRSCRSGEKIFLSPPPTITAW